MELSKIDMQQLKLPQLLNKMPSDLPDNLVILEYAQLAPRSELLGRLQVLAAIGRLLSMSAHEHVALSTLASKKDVQDSLCDWLAREPANRFWCVRDDHVHVQQICEKHILVGTRQLLADLASVRLEWSLPDLTDLDRLWQSAAQHMAQYSDGFAGEANE